MNRISIDRPEKVGDLWLHEGGMFMITLSQDGRRFEYLVIIENPTHSGPSRAGQIVDLVPMSYPANWQRIL